MKNRLYVFSILAIMSLVSCSGNREASRNNYTSSSAWQQPTTSVRQPTTSVQQPATSIWTPPASSTPTYSSKQAVIDWLRTNGSYSNGEYTISQTSYSESTTVLDTVAYDVSQDQFVSSVLLYTVSSGVGSVSNFGMVQFSWGSFRNGSFLGMTTYSLNSGTTYKNAFSFNLSFSSYPTFSINTYNSLQIQYSSSASSDASFCAACLTRAINVLVNSLPSMGSKENLW